MCQSYRGRSKTTIHFKGKGCIITITVKDMGDIVIQLFPEVAPNTVANFIAYSVRGDYQNNGKILRKLVIFILAIPKK